LQAINRLHLRKHLMLVGKFPASIEHRSLVERSKGDGVDLAALGKIYGVGKCIACELAGFG